MNRMVYLQGPIVGSHKKVLVEFSELPDSGGANPFIAQKRLSSLTDASKILATPGRCSIPVSGYEMFWISPQMHCRLSGIEYLAGKIHPARIFLHTRARRFHVTLRFIYLLSSGINRVIGIYSRFQPNAVDLKSSSIHESPATT